MKKDIHPKFYEEAKVGPSSKDDHHLSPRSVHALGDMTIVSFKLLGESLMQVICNGEEVLTVSGTKEKYVVDVWSGNHPFFKAGTSSAASSQKLYLQKLILQPSVSSMVLTAARSWALWTALYAYFEVSSDACHTSGRGLESSSFWMRVG